MSFTASLPTSPHLLLFSIGLLPLPRSARQLSPRILVLPACLAVLVTTYRDYSSWYALGPAGVPHNIFGYLEDVLLRAYVAIAHRERRSVDVYKDGMGERWYLKDLEVRKGDRPKLHAFVVPHRQCIGNSPELRHTETTTLFQDMISAHPDAGLIIGTSEQERHGPALFLKSLDPSIPPREVAHLHEADGSAHTTLSLADAKKVVEKGWGERHGLSGQFLPGITLGFTMVYAPRDAEELSVMKQIFEAAIGFAEDFDTNLAVFS